MRAFTHLCEKVNISLFDDTLTLYPKPTGTTHHELLLDMARFQLLCVEMGCNYVNDDEMYAVGTELGVKRYVFQEDPDHMRYHDDDFKIGDPHFHAQFSMTINEDKLKEITRAFVKYHLLSSSEESSFIAAYELANTMPAVVVKPAKMEIENTAPVSASKFGGSFFSWLNKAAAAGAPGATPGHSMYE